MCQGRKWGREKKQRGKLPSNNPLMAESLGQNGRAYYGWSQDLMCLKYIQYMNLLCLQRNDTCIRHPVRRKRRSWVKKIKLFH